LNNRIPFDFEFPVEFFEKADAAPGKQRRIGGIASLESRDRQGEIILQRGLDFSDFIANGWFNDNHSKETTDILGYPEEVKFFRKGQTLPTGRKAPANGHWVEGYLIDVKKSDEVWNLGKALQKTNRRLGFSVEGKILERTGAGNRTIAKALVRNVAITNCPVHTGARMDILAKSLMTAERINLERSMGMGEVADPGVKVSGKKTGMGAGRVVARQSLESQFQKPLRLNEAKKDEEDEESKKSMSDAEAFAWFRTRLPKASPSQIGRLIEVARKLKS